MGISRNELGPAWEPGTSGSNLRAAIGEPQRWDRDPAERSAKNGYIENKEQLDLAVMEFLASPDTKAWTQSGEGATIANRAPSAEVIKGLSRLLNVGRDDLAKDIYESLDRISGGTPVVSADDLVNVNIGYTPEKAKALVQDAKAEAAKIWEGVPERMDVERRLELAADSRKLLTSIEETAKNPPHIEGGQWDYQFLSERLRPLLSNETTAKRLGAALKEMESHPDGRDTANAYRESAALAMHYDRADLESPRKVEHVVQGGYNLLPGDKKEIRYYVEMPHAGSVSVFAGPSIDKIDRANPIETNPGSLNAENANHFNEGFVFRARNDDGDNKFFIFTPKELFIEKNALNGGLFSSKAELETTIAAVKERIEPKPAAQKSPLDAALANIDIPSLAVYPGTNYQNVQDGAPVSANVSGNGQTAGQSRK